MLCIRVLFCMLLCELCHYMRLIVILSLCMCNGIFTIIQLFVLSVMFGFVNMASAICMLTLFR